MGLLTGQWFLHAQCPLRHMGIFSMPFPQTHMQALCIADEQTQYHTANKRVPGLANLWALKAFISPGFCHCGWL
jgi:hypothetical protein